MLIRKTYVSIKHDLCNAGMTLSHITVANYIKLLFLKLTLLDWCKEYFVVRSYLCAGLFRFLSNIYGCQYFNEA